MLKTQTCVTRPQCVKMNVCKTGHDLLTQNRVTYCSPKHDYNRKQKEVPRMERMTSFNASHNLPMKRGPKRLTLTKISRYYQYQNACEQNSQMIAGKCWQLLWRSEKCEENVGHPRYRQKSKYKLGYTRRQRGPLHCVSRSVSQTACR